MEAEISEEIGAAHGEVSVERTTHRNGYRPRPWEIRVGEIELPIPRKRSGEAYFPSFLEPRKRSDQAIVAVVMEAYVNGVSTRKVDRLVEQLGIHGMTKDRVSALCRALDEQVEAFRSRPLEGEHPYLWLDAKRVKVRDRGHVYPKALVIAYSVHESGRREVIGLDIGEIETEASWVSFLRCASAASEASAPASPLSTSALRPRSSACSPVPGSAARSTSSATCCATAGPPSAAWSRRHCGRSSTRQATRRRGAESPR
jgi:putative transposase